MLHHCVESIVAQSFKGWRLVVGDNASSDGAAEALRSIADHRISVVRRETDLGWVANMNLLVAAACDSDYVAILHADDWWDPSFLQTTVDLLDNLPSAVIAATGVRVHRASGDDLLDGIAVDRPAGAAALCSSEEAQHVLVDRNRLLAPSVLARGRLYKVVPPFEPTLPFCCDWLMWLRATRVGDVAVVPRSIAHYRHHDSNLSATGARQGLWGPDRIRMLRMVLSDWARDGEPFAGASTRFSHRIVGQLASAAQVLAEGGDQEGALFHVRLARAAATTRGDSMLCIGLEAVLGATGADALRPARRRLMSIGERLLPVQRTVDRAATADGDSDAPHTQLIGAAARDAAG